jgi:hypothetical protein
MTNKIIRLCYRKIINTSSLKAWDKNVFESSYAEFLMQAQFYDQEKKYTTFANLLINTPSSDKLHFLVSAAITGYLQQLEGRVPDILNTLEMQFLEFRNYRFEILNSDIKNKATHEVAISFFSEQLVWHDTIDNCLLVSTLHAEKNEEGFLTHLVQLKPFLSIYSIKEETT